MTSTPQVAPSLGRQPDRCVAGGGAATPRSWRIEFPPGIRLLTSNQQGGAWQKQFPDHQADP